MTDDKLVPNATQSPSESEKIDLTGLYNSDPDVYNKLKKIVGKEELRKAIKSNPLVTNKQVSSLADLEEMQAMEDIAWELDELVWNFFAVWNNIASEMFEGDRQGAIGNLLGEMQDRVDDIIIERGRKPKKPRWRKDVVETVLEKDGLTLFKSKQDEYLLLCNVTNNFQDLEKEILTDKAHKEHWQWLQDAETEPKVRLADVAKQSKTLDDIENWLNNNPSQMPELWTFHIDGTERKSRATWYDYDGNFFWYLFPLTDSEANAVKSFTEAYEPALSHGFVALETSGSEGQYVEKYRTFEVTLLPKDQAANVWTIPYLFNVNKGSETMPFTDVQREVLQSMYLDESTIEQLESKSNETAKTLAAIGIQSKQNDTNEQESDVMEGLTGEVDISPANAVLEQPQLIDDPPEDEEEEEEKEEVVINPDELVEIISMQNEAIKALKAELVTLRKEIKDTSKHKGKSKATLASILMEMKQSATSGKKANYTNTSNVVTQQMRDLNKTKSGDSQNTNNNHSLASLFQG